MNLYSITEKAQSFWEIVETIVLSDLFDGLKCFQFDDKVDWGAPRRVAYRTVTCVQRRAATN
jgi:hypothetical protein